MTKRILLTYDFIATNSQRGAINQKWILQTFSTLLTKLDVVVDESLDRFSPDVFFEASNINNVNQAYRDVDVSQVSNHSKSYLTRALEVYDIVIGCELSAPTKELLTTLGICYIDIWLSPIRFYKDVMFEFHSNSDHINACLQGYRFDRSLLDEQVLKLTQHAEQFLERPSLAENSCLLIGQMQQDKSVLYQGRYLSLLDYTSEIAALCDTYSCVYLLKHPYLNAHDFAPIKCALSRFENLVALEHHNTYALLMSPAITSVAGISSSVLAEAQYFGKTVKYFYKPVIEPDYICIFKDYFESSFWSTLLNIPDQMVRYFAEDNYFRHKYAMAYAYDIFMPTAEMDKRDETQGYVSILNLFSFIQHLEIDKDYLLYGFGSVGKLIFPHIKGNLLAVIDKKFDTKTPAHEGILMLNPDQIVHYPNTPIIVSSFLYNQQIIKDLKDFDNPIVLIEG